MDTKKNNNLVYNITATVTYSNFNLSTHFSNSEFKKAAREVTDKILEATGQQSVSVRTTPSEKHERLTGLHFQCKPRHGKLS